MYISESDVNFAKLTLSDFVNGRMSNPKVVAAQMARDHRYLQTQMFKICFHYIRILAANYENGKYDDRNEWACRLSDEIVKSTKSMPDLDKYDLKELEELNRLLCNTRI